MAPRADAGRAETALVGDSVMLDGDASGDGDSDELAYDWRITARPGASSAKPTPSNSDRPSLDIDAAGTYVAQVEVDDGPETSAARTVMISAGGENLVPVADAGPDRVVALAQRSRSTAPAPATGTATR